MRTAWWSAVVLAAALTACSPAKDGGGAQPTNAAAGENPLTAPADYLGAVSAAQKSAVRVVDLAAVQQAIQMFNVSEGRYPGQLNELVTEGYLPRLPDLPTGMTYQYDPASGQVRAVRR
jgi:hypothetical protein